MRSPAPWAGFGAWFTVVLLTAALASGCMVRLEPVSPRAAPGDHFATSAGLRGHERWLAWAPDAVEPPSEDGITLAAVAPPRSNEALVTILPGVEEAPANGAQTGPDRVPTPLFRPGVAVGDLRVAMMPPPRKPENRPVTTDQPAHGLSARELASAAGAVRPAASGGDFERRAPVASSRSAERPAAVALAPGLELAQPGDDIIWLAMARAGSVMPAAGPERDARSMPDRTLQHRGQRTEPTRLFPRPGSSS